MTVLESSTIASITLPVEMPWRKVLPRPRVCNRDQALIQLATGKTVLHVGAADAPLTEENYQKGTLLHLKLRPVVKQMVGVDICAPSVDYLHKQTQIDDIVVADIIARDPQQWDERLNQTFDLIYCCDIIEHVANPGQLLENMLPFCHAETRIVLTTPNALSLKGALRPLLLGKEFIHPDHVAYYSFSTLSELMRRSGIEPVGYGVYAYYSPNPVARWVFDALYQISPNSAEGFILMGRPREFARLAS